jgi:hypothetical protein
MPTLPEVVIEAWKDRDGPIVLTTVDENGVPNAIYASCVSRYDDDETFIIADNYFDKTKKNIFSGSVGSLLFITKERKSYQIKGELEYYTEGEYYQDMKRWNNEGLPGHAAAVIRVQDVYKGATKLV